jgi:hypothetical protein
MIFGFNTDVKSGDSVFHVQSEARQRDLLLQTMVFVRGQCIGKFTSSYAEQASLPNFSDQSIHELLKEQHRAAVESAREGRLGDFFEHGEEIQDTAGLGLTLKWINESDPIRDNRVRMRFSVLDDKQAADGALLTCRLTMSQDAPIHAQTATEADGTAEVEVNFGELGPDQVPEVLVRAKHGEKSATRKYRLKANQ